MCVIENSNYPLYTRILVINICFNTKEKIIKDDNHRILMDI